MRRPSRAAVEVLAFQVGIALAVAITMTLAVRADDAKTALGVTAVLAIAYLLRNVDLSRVHRLKGGPFEFELREATDALRTAVEQAVVDGGTADESAGIATAVAGEVARASSGATDEENRQLRDQLYAAARRRLPRPETENLIRSAAHWGWLQAKHGMWQSEPVPLIDWHDGKPRILAGQAVVEQPGGVVTQHAPTLGWSTEDPP